MLSKYDVMEKKIDKFSNIMASCVASYALAFTQKRKYEVIKKYYDIIITEAHILFEIKNDVVKYAKANNKLDNQFVLSIEEKCNEFVKILVLDAMLKNKNEKLLYDFVIDLISKKKGKDDAINFVYSNLNEEEISVLEFMNSDEFNFEELNEKYKDRVCEKHKYYMKKNINQYVTKKENDKIEFFKGIKIYEENANVDFKLKIDIPQKKL